MTVTTFTWIGSNGGLWNSPSNWTTLATGNTPALTSPGAGDTAIAQDSASPLETIVGPGTAAELDLIGNIGLQGAFNVGTLMTDSLTDSANTIEAATTIDASVLEVGNESTLSVAGLGAILQVGTAVANYPFTFHTESADSVLNALNGGSIDIQNSFQYGFIVNVDSASVIELGTAGTGVAGAVNVDAGSTIVFGEPVIQGNLVIAAGATVEGNGNTLVRGSAAIGAGAVLDGTLQAASLSNNGTILTREMVVDPSLASSTMPQIVTGTGLIEVGDSGIFGQLGILMLRESVAPGSMTFQLNSGARMFVGGAIGTGNSIVFAGNTSGPGETLVFGAQATPTATIYGFQAGDTIDTTALAGVSMMFGTAADGSATAIFSNNGSAIGTLTFEGQTQGQLSLDPTTGDVIACFAAGTRIATPHGDVAVERLNPGDPVLTASGRQLPIRWIGRRGLDCRRHDQPEQVMPVRIRAGAFAERVPARDLWLSPDHAVFVENVLIPIKHLINGTSVAQVSVDQVTYYHVELPRHDVLLAEGMPAESYLDTGDRANFANGGGVMRLHPDFSNRPAHASRLWEAYGCAPLVVTGRQVDVVRQRLDERAAVQAASFPAPTSNASARSIRASVGVSCRKVKAESPSSD